MKTILLILLLSAASVWGQPPTGTNDNPNAAREAIRARLRAQRLTNNPSPFPTFPAPSLSRPSPVNPAGSNAVPSGAIPGGANQAVTPGQPLSAPGLAGAAPPTAVTGPNGGAGGDIIETGSINFPDTDLNQVLDVYAALVGRTILRPSNLPATHITLVTQTPLTRMEAISAFNAVFALNGITVINVGDKFAKVLPDATAFQGAAPFNRDNETNLAEMGSYVTRIVQVRYAKPTELVPALQPFAKIPNSILPIDSSGVLIIRDYSENVKRMLELIKQIDVTVPLDFESEVIPIKYALASDISSALSSLGGGTGTTVGRGTGGSSTGARLGSGFGGGGGVGGAGGFGANTTGTLGSAGGLGGFQSQGGLGSTTGGPRASSFGDRLGQIINRAANSGQFQVLGDTKIIADERTNSLLVFAGKQDMAMIKDIIKKLDIVLAQVLIEAIILEVTLNDDESFGVSSVQNSPSAPGNYFSGIGGVNNGTFLNGSSFSGLANGASNAIPSGFSYFANFGNDFQATITALAQKHRVIVLSRPRIQTSHAVTASLKVGQSVPEVTGTYFGGINGAASSQYSQTFVGIDLQVTPLINPDGLVVMDIAQDIEDLGPNYTIDGNQVPSTTQRTAVAKVSVQDGETIILGGFISKNKTQDRAGVPFLKDIPLLGALFRSTADSNQRTELIVLIRPTVLPTPQAAAVVASRERGRLPLVKAAEADLEKERIKDQKEADKIRIPLEDDSIKLPKDKVYNWPDTDSKQP